MAISEFITGRSNKLMKVSCIIPTYNGRSDLQRLLQSLVKQTYPLDLFIVDSSSTDGTLEIAKQYTKNVTVIPSSEFNHGGTRQLIANENPQYDIYIYLTQDAYLEDNLAIEKLIAHFDDDEVGAVCGRQLPHLSANLLAQHARYFNYPDTVQVKSLADKKLLGIKVAFMSNSFAAYRAKDLRAVGGFPDHVIFAEDMLVAGRMILSGLKVVYAGDAACRHSHNYSFLEEFKRYFDMGVFHAREPWIRKEFGGAGGEGLRYVKSELRFLGVSRWYLWPSSILRNGLKLLAYKLGQNERFLSKNTKKKLGMYKGYWESPYGDTI